MTTAQSIPSLVSQLLRIGAKLVLITPLAWTVRLTSVIKRYLNILFDEICFSIYDAKLASPFFASVWAILPNQIQRFHVRRVEKAVLRMFTPFMFFEPSIDDPILAGNGAGFYLDTNSSTQRILIYYSGLVFLRNGLARDILHLTLNRSN